jgi:hypothetical protein
MADTPRYAPDWLIRWELVLVVAACSLALSSIPLMLGHIGLSWDALNHHIYLGWTADRPRFAQDYLAASYQAYQYPYLYWPVYKLALGGASGMLAGVVLAQLHLLAVPAVWKMARACIPGHEWFDLTMRALAVALAFVSGVVLSMFDTTGNDLLAAIPLVWAIALALEPLSQPRPVELLVRRAVWSSGMLAGVSVAFKLSNAPVAIVLPLLWLWPGGGIGARLRRLLWGGSWTAVGFLLAYGYWGWQLWTHFGNPIYPLYDNWFGLARAWSGWAR